MAAAAEAPAKDTNWLSEVVEKQTGKKIQPTGLRVILRRLANAGEIEREEGRYSFAGLKDPAVVAVVAAVKAGDGEPKPRAAKKAAAKKAPAAKRTRKKVAEPEVEEDEDLELDEI